MMTAWEEKDILYHIEVVVVVVVVVVAGTPLERLERLIPRRRRRRRRRKRNMCVCNKDIHIRTYEVVCSS